MRKPLLVLSLLGAAYLPCPHHPRTHRFTTPVPPVWRGRCQRSMDRIWQTSAASAYCKSAVSSAPILVRPRSGLLDKTQPLQPAGGLPAAQDTSFHSSQPPFVPQQLAERLGKTQQERQYIEGVLTKCLNFYTDTAIQKGVPLNDVARALNYFISTNYFVYSLGAGPTPEQMNATRDSIRDNMAQDDAFRRMSDKQKQEAYETLIVLAGFVDLGFGTAKQTGDANAAAQFREMAKHNLETLLGAPIEKIHFTNDGLAVD